MTAALAILVGFLLSNMPSPVYPLWQDSMGFTASTTTVLFAIYQAGVLVGLVLLGRLADRWGTRPMLVAAMVATGVAALMFAFAPDPAGLLAARALSGLSVGVLASCGAAAVTAQQEHRGRTNGPVVASVVTSMGLAFGPLLGGIGVDLNTQPERSTFLIEVGLAALAAVLIVSGLGWRTPAAAEAPTGVREGAAALATPVPGRRAGMATAMLVVATAGIVCAIYMSIGSGFIRDALAVSSGTVGGLLVFVVFASAFLSQLSLRRKTAVVQGTTAMAASIAAAVLLVVGLSAGSVGILFASAALSGVSQGVAQTAGLIIARRLTPLSRLRAAFAWLNFASYLFGGGFVLVAGVLLGVLSSLTVVSVIGAVVCVMAVVGILLLWRNRIVVSPSRTAQTADSAGYDDISAGPRTT